MIRKILAINGGGVTDVAYLTYMLNISKHYDKQNIDLLLLFNTFSGVSSGSSIASAFALREKFLQNIAKRNPHIIISALKKINNEYSKNDILSIIKNLKKMEIINCSSIVIATLIVLFETEMSNIFNRSTFRQIVSINGLLFSKYDDNKKHVFDKYFNFKLKDIPVDRTLVIKSIDIINIKLQVYTNYVTSQKNDFLVNDPDQSVSQAVDFSSNAPTYFPFNKMIDGGFILNTSLLEQIFIFKNDDLVIFKLNDVIKPYIKKNIVFDGILGWARPLLKAGIFYENEIFKKLLEFKYQEKIHISNFDLTKYSLDNINQISEIENVGKKKSIKSAVTFMNRELTVDNSKIINTWKDTWQLTKSESKGDMPATIVACEYGLRIDYCFTDDNKLYIINNVTNGETETYDWNYDSQTTKLLYKNVNDINDIYNNEIIRLNEKELVLGDEGGYTYLRRRINYDYINKKIASHWMLVKQEKNGKDNTASLHDNSITVMKIANDFKVDIVMGTKDQPVESTGQLYIDVEFGTLTIEQSTSNNNDESSSIVLTIISFTINELKVMQKIDNEELISTYIRDVSDVVLTSGN